MLNIYRGRETVDKEKFIYSKIKELGAGNRSIVIVPDQYTLVAEKQALAKLNSKVLLDVEILSLSRLGTRLLAESGADKKKLINRYGRHMLISKILRDENESLDAFRGMWNRENFVAAVNDFISKAKQYEVAPDEIGAMLAGKRKAAGGAGSAAGGADAADEAMGVLEEENESALQRKLKDINHIYKKYEEEIAGKYTDAEDLIGMYEKAAGESELVSRSHIWIYGFDSFTPKNLSFISALMERALSVNVFLTHDSNCRDGDLFRLSGRVTSELVKAAEAVNSRYSVIDLTEEDTKTFAARERGAGIATLERELFSVGIKPMEGEEAYEGVTLVKCGSPYSEAEAAASHIRALLREKNYHFSDILLICNDQSERGGIISRVFQEYGLEVFDDKKRQMISSALAVFISSLLTTMIYGYRAEDVMRALKTGLTDVTGEEIIALEEYAYRLRIRGSLWKKAFSRGSYMRRYADGGLEEIEEIRKKAMKPFIIFEKIYKESKTYSEFIRQVSDFIENDVNITEKMNALAERQRSIGASDVAEETEQLWEVMQEIFSQIEEIMGDTPFEGKEFSELLRAGLSQIEIGVLPPSADDMLLGTMQRTRTGDVKALIVMGANDGILPLTPSEDVLFSKEEMAELEEEGFAFGSDTEVRRMEEDLALYRSLYKPEEDLWISYSTAGVKGDALQPSEVVATIKKIFKDIKEIEDPNLSEDISLRLGGETNTLRRYSEAMHDSQLGIQIDEGWNAVSDWLAANDEKSGRENLKTINDSFEFENIQEPIGAKLADDLYGDRYSPSELENYSRCPFKHFIDYGINAEEQRVDEVAQREIGTLYHGILERFAAELTDKNIWDSITKEEAEAMIEDYANSWAEDYHDGLFKISGAETYLLKRAIAACKFVAWTLVEQARAGEIKESRYEVRFGRWGQSGDGKERLKPIVRKLSDGREVYIEGIIDRLDVLESDRVKIIDYKTGNEKFDVDEVRAGYRLQLMLYLEAARGEERKPAGVFYFLIHEPRGKVDVLETTENQEAIDEALRAGSQMNGVVLNDEEVIREIAGEFEDKSTVIQLTRKKDGSFNKNSERYLISEEALDGLQDEVKEITKDLCEGILSGRIELMPKKPDKSDPCRYCDYHSICNFDRGFKGCNYDYI